MLEQGTIKSDFSVGFLILFYILLLSTVLPVSQITGSTVGGLFVIGAYSVFILAIYISTGTIKIKVPKFVLLFVLLMSVVFSSHLLIGNYQSITNVGAAVLTIGIFFINITIIPQYISNKDFIWAVIIFSLILALVGIFMNAIHHAGLLRSTFVWHDSVLVPVTGFSTPYLMSITANPNNLGFVLFVGFIFSMGVYRLENNRRMVPIILVIGFSLFLTQSRASWLAAAMALFVLICHIDLKMSSRTILISVLGVVTAIFFIPILLRSGIGYNIELSGRVILWTGAILAVFDNLLIGYGFGSTSQFIEGYISGRYSGHSVHNSYLRVFLIGGIAAGIAYILLIVRSLTIFKNNTENKFTTIIFSAALGVPAHQLFEAYTMLGYTIHSVLAAILFGYVILGYVNGK